MTAPNLTPDERVAATLAFLRDVLGLQVSVWQERAIEKLVAPLSPPARPVPPPGGAVHLGLSAGAVGYTETHGGAADDCPKCSPRATQPFHEGPREAIHHGPRAGCPDCPPGDPAGPFTVEEYRAQRAHDPLMVTVDSLLQDPGAVREALADLYQPRKPVLLDQREAVQLGTLRIQIDPTLPEGEWRLRGNPAPDQAMDELLGIAERLREFPAKALGGQMDRDLEGYRSLGVACPACDTLAKDGAHPASDTCRHPWHGQR